MDSSPLFKEIETENSLGRLCVHRYLSVHGGGGLCPGGISVQWGALCRGDPFVRLRAGGTHPTGMHSCFRIKCLCTKFL